MASLEEMLQERLRGRGGEPAAPTGEPANPLEQKLQGRLRERYAPASEPYGGGLGLPGEMPEMQPFLPAADDFLAAQVRQPALGDGRLTTGDRAVMGLRDNFQERQNVFKQRYPRGDLIEIEVPGDLDYIDAGERVELFRKQPDEPWSRVDPRAVEMGDVGDVAGAAPAVAGEVASAMATRGMGFLMRTAGTALGGVLGEASMDTLDRLQGVKTEDFGQQMDRTIQQGMVGLFGAAAGDLFGLALRPLTGRGLTSSSAMALEAEDMAVRYGLPRLSGGQLSRSPLVQRQMNQAVAKSDAAQQLIEKQSKATIEALARREDPIALGQVRPQLEKYVDEQTQAVASILRVPGTNLEQTAAELKHAFQAWRTGSKNAVDTMYAVARRIGTPTFDLRGLKQDAAGALALANRGALDMDSEMRTALERIAGLPDDLTQIQAPMPDGSIASASGEQILNEIRSQFFQLANPQPGSPLRTTRSMKFASDFGRRAWEVFQNPSNIDELPGFRKAWTDAADMASKRFETIEMFDALVSLRSREFNPQSIVRKIFSSSGGGDEIVSALNGALREQGLLERWVPIQQGFRSELIRSAIVDGPDSVLHSLAKFQPTTLQKLMGGREMIDFRNSLKQWSDLKALGIKDILNEQVSNADMVMKLVGSNNKRAMDELVRRAPANSDLGRSIRAGLIDKILSHQETLELPGRLLGQRVLNPAKIEATIAALEKTGADRFLEAGDKEFIRGLVKYLHQTGTGLDFSAGLAGGEAAGAVGRVVSEPVSAVSTMLHVGLLGRVLATNSRWGRSLLVGLRPGERSDPTFMRAFGAMASDVSQSVQEERKRKNETSIPRPIMRRMGLE